MTERQFEPAFPILDDCNGLGLVLRDAGMSLRDYFAAKAMQTLIRTYGNDGNYEKCASEAFNFADAMLEARKNE